MAGISATEIEEPVAAEAEEFEVFSVGIGELEKVVVALGVDSIAAAETVPPA